MDVKCTSSVTAEPGDFLTAGAVSAWANSVPDEAQLTPVLRDYGSQRDPMTVLAGITATWTETR